MNDSTTPTAGQVAIGAFLRARRAPSGAAELARAWLKANGGDLDAVVGDLLVRLHRLEDRSGSGEEPS
jgi:hypothetical protein